VAELNARMREESGMQNKKISRRDFFGWVIKGGLLTALAGMAFPVLSYLWPVTRQGLNMGQKELGTVEDIPIWGSKKVIIGDSAFIVIRTPDEIKVFSAICTHLGCIVEWDAQRKGLVCPCHAAFFDLEGRIVSGPPPKPLSSFKAEVVNGKIYIR